MPQHVLSLIHGHLRASFRLCMNQSRQQFLLMFMMLLPQRRWLRDAVGLQLYHGRPAADQSRKLLKRLTQVETFERYLHQTYPGQKRFSIEGTDVQVPMLDKIIDGAVESGAGEVIIGMAHR